MVKKKKKTAANTKAYGMPLRIKSKVVVAVNLLQEKKIPFNRKLWLICKELADMKGIKIE